MTFDLSIRPRISDTDMFGHINNVAVVAWLEEGRTYMSRRIIENHQQAAGFVVARIELDYLGQLYFGQEVRVATGVEHLGNSSVRLRQEVWQHEQCCARAVCTLVHIDRGTQRSTPLPDWLREGFSAFMIE